MVPEHPPGRDSGSDRSDRTTRDVLLLAGGVAAAVTALIVVQQRSGDDVNIGKTAAVSKTPEHPATVREKSPALTPLQQKLATLDQKVFVLSRDPAPEGMYDMYNLVKEFQTTCEDLLDASETPDDVKEKARVLREAIDLLEQVKAGPETDQDEYLKFLEEINKDGNLDAMLAKLKAMTPKEFEEHQKKEFSVSVSKSLDELIQELQEREKIGRDEHELVHIALYCSDFPDDDTVEEKRREVGQLNEDRWLANFPPERREEWHQAKREHVNAIVKTLNDPDTTVPEMPENLRDIDDPYAKEREAERAQDQKRFEEELHQHERLQQALQRLIDQLKMKPEESDRVEEELQKARQRVEAKGEKR